MSHNSIPMVTLFPETPRFIQGYLRT
jgi:hypothetical protein